MFKDKADIFKKAVYWQYTKPNSYFSKMFSKPMK